VHGGRTKAISGHIARIMPWRGVCPSVCHVRVLYRIETSKHILKLLHLLNSDSPNIVDLLEEMLWRNYHGIPLNGGVECIGGYEKIAILDQDRFISETTQYGAIVIK